MHLGDPFCFAGNDVDLAGVVDPEIVMGSGGLIPQQVRRLVQFGDAVVLDDDQDIAVLH